ENDPRDALVDRLAIASKAFQPGISPVLGHHPSTSAPVDNVVATVTNRRNVTAELARCRREDFHKDRVPCRVARAVVRRRTPPMRKQQAEQGGLVLGQVLLSEYRTGSCHGDAIFCAELSKGLPALVGAKRVRCRRLDLQSRKGGQRVDRLEPAVAVLADGA